MRLSENIRKVTLPLHLLLIVAVVWMATSKDVSRLAWALPIWSIISGLGVAIGYHRLLSHNAFATTLFKKRLLAVIGIFAGQGSPVFWTATHRGLHHPFSDQEKDPHSPTKGFWHAYLGWQLTFDRSSFNPRHAIDLLRDPFIKFVSVHYHKVYWTLPLLIFVIDWKFALGALIPAMALSAHQENLVNALGHNPTFGYRNFNLTDDSTNLKWLALITWGQALHNNHHRFPKRWNFATNPGEFDPCALLVPWLIAKERSPAKIAKGDPASPAKIAKGDPARAK